MVGVEIERTAQKSQLVGRDIGEYLVDTDAAVLGSVGNALYVVEVDDYDGIAELIAPVIRRGGAFRR